MEYVYSPDSYNYNLINEKFKSNQEFVELQIAYRTGLEKLLKEVIDFKEIEAYILNSGVDVPKVNDKEYNFYHKYSTLESDYLFLRNNFHVENLSKEELDNLRNSSKCDLDFFKKTLNNVIFEAGDATFFGIPVPTNLVKSKSIVFEFAYNQLECETIEQLVKIQGISDNIFKVLESRIRNNLNLDSSFVVYQAVVDYYKANNEKCLWFLKDSSKSLVMNQKTI